MNNGVVQFSRYNLFDVAEGLRKLADDIQAGKRDATRVVVCMEADGGEIDYFACGRDFPKSQAVGLCERVKMRIME